jgi:hypothetical protein
MYVRMYVHMGSHHRWHAWFFKRNKEECAAVHLACEFKQIMSRDSFLHLGALIALRNFTRALMCVYVCVCVETRKYVRISCSHSISPIFIA